MCCEYCEKNMEHEEDDIIVNTNGIVRSAMRDIGDFLIWLCRELDIDEIKIKAYHDYDTCENIFKAKVDGKKVVKITENDSDTYDEE